MFKSPRPNLYESSEGFSVEVVGFSQVVYRESGRTVVVEAEALAPPGAMAIYSSSIKSWAAPYDREAIEESERERIISNIVRAFASQGLTAEVA